MKIRDKCQMVDKDGREKQHGFKKKGSAVETNINGFKTLILLLRFNQDLDFDQFLFFYRGLFVQKQDFEGVV